MWQPTELEKEAMSISGTENWYPWIFVKTSEGILCTGAVCPLKTRGPNKGEPNYRKADSSTKRKVLIRKK